MRSAVVACAWVLGCGRIGFDASGDAGRGGDAQGDAQDATVGTTATCPTTIALTDDFTTQGIQPGWAVFLNGSGVTHSQGAGALVLAFSNGTTPPGSSTGYTQKTAIDYSEACATIELDALPTGGSTVVYVGAPGAFVEFEFAAGVMYCNRSSGGIGDQRPWDPVAHKFLRLHGHANAWSWEVSPDDVSYTTLATQSPNTSTTNPTTMTIEIVAPNNVTNGGSARFTHARVVVP